MQDAFDVQTCIQRVQVGDAVAAESLVDHLHPLVRRWVRNHLPRRESEEDLVQQVLIKVFQKLDAYVPREGVPFEHWVSRLAVRTCYDFLRGHQRNRETNFTEISDAEDDWLERHSEDPDNSDEKAGEAKELVDKVLEKLSPSARLVITLLEIEDRSVKEISELTGWSVPLVKVRAFRARAEMKKCLQRITRDKYL